VECGKKRREGGGRKGAERGPLFTSAASAGALGGFVVHGRRKRPLTLLAAIAVVPLIAQRCAPAGRPGWGLSHSWGDRALKTDDCGNRWSRPFAPATPRA